MICLSTFANPADPFQTDLEDCADMYITAAKNSSMTGQNLQIGSSNTHVTTEGTDLDLDSGFLMLGRTAA